MCGITYISNALYIIGVVCAAVGAIVFCMENADLMLAVRLMAGGVVATGAGNILIEGYEWWEDIRTEV